MTATWEIREGDAFERLAGMPDESAQCCVTSPPYFGLRDYGIEGQIGLEATPDEFVARLVGVFREVRRVLRSDGTLWLNLGDSYAANRTYQVPDNKHRDVGNNMAMRVPAASEGTKRPDGLIPAPALAPGCKAKDLLGIPWLLAFALRADGWYLRSDVIWAKPNPMPESVTDRPTSAHEHLFLLSKSPRYFYDADAIREEPTEPFRASKGAFGLAYRENQLEAQNGSLNVERTQNPAGRNKRNVWEIATQPYPDAHFATFPPKLVEPCILAGSSPKACGECGAPWQRVTERDGYDNGDGSPGERGLGDARILSREETGRADGFTKPPRNAASTTRTVGWEPSCAHQDDTGHSVILDPFAGAGTTGVVALRHVRSFVGIELSPAYAEMARERIRCDAPLLNTPAEVAA